ncbi:MAG: hypothetical protein J1F11_04905 [Oscillospiraceae bacterium]|nr:hypothetical protein [Oscillospiraceae bacterium]
MGILNEMFGEGDSAAAAPAGEFLAEGDYESSREKMLSGYKEFRKIYTVKSLIGRLFVVLLATASAVFMIVTSSGDQREIPIFCLILCLFIGGWFIRQSVSNKKKYLQSVDALTGIPYHAEVFTDKIKITDMSPLPEPVEEESPENKGESADETGLSEKKEVPENENKNISGEAGLPGEISESPSTVIHLNEYIVDILDREDVYVLVVRKAYVFIIPKDAFSEDENKKIREKLSAIMGIRYKK